MGKVAKDERLQLRISSTLKERFMAALAQEGIDATDFLISRIYEFVEKAEKKQEA